VSKEATHVLTAIDRSRQEFAATRLAPLKQGRPAGGARQTLTNAPNGRAADIGWQVEVMAAFRQVPELRYVTNAIARAASICPVVPDKDRRKGPEIPVVSKTSPSTPADAIPAALVYRASQLLTLVGEYFIVSRRRVDGASETAILSPTEIRRSALFWELPAPWGLWYPGTKGPQDVRLTRVHQPSPEAWERSDSAPASALPVLRELIGLTMAISSTIDSRLAGAGVITYPMGAEVGAPPGDTSGPFDNDLPLGDALMQAMIEPIGDRASAAARVPVTIGIPDEYAGKGAVEHITFAVPLDAQIPELIDKCIRRLAMGMDAPPEVLLGMQNTASLGAAWLVSDDRIRTHIVPLLELVAAGFAVHMERDYTFDISPLQVHPNLAPEAKDAYDRGVISDASYRRAIGFVDEDAPPSRGDDVDEAAWDIVQRLLRHSPSLAQTPGIPAVYAQIKATLRGEAPDNAIYPGKDIEVSEDEVPRAEGAPIPDRSEPRNAPPAADPRGQQPRSEGAPNRGRAGEPRQRPGVGT
jgi:hypothetical protein